MTIIATHTHTHTHTHTKKNQLRESNAAIETVPFIDVPFEASIYIIYHHLQLGFSIVTFDYQRLTLQQPHFWTRSHLDPFGASQERWLLQLLQ